MLTLYLSQIKQDIRVIRNFRNSRAGENIADRVANCDPVFVSPIF